MNQEAAVDRFYHQEVVVPERGCDLTCLNKSVAQPALELSFMDKQELHMSSDKKGCLAWDPYLTEKKWKEKFCQISQSSSVFIKDVKVPCNMEH